MKLYYNQEIISTTFRKFFQKFSILTKPFIKNLSYIMFGLISAESVVTSDFSRKLKDDFSFVHLPSFTVDH